MLFRDKIFAQLEAKQAGFRNYNDDARHEAAVYAEALQRLGELVSDEIQQRVATIVTPGALPTTEFDAAPQLRMRFPHEFHNHENARHWACEALLHHTTCAADGSQLTPQFGLRAVMKIPAETLDEGLVRHQILLIAVPDEDGTPFGSPSAGEFQRESRLSDAWLTRHEH